MESEKKQRNRKWIWKILLLLAVILLIYVIASLWISYNLLLVQDYTVTLGQGEKEIKAVVIGDLHDNEFGEENQELAEKIAETEPDLILMDGDMLNGDSDSASIPVELIKKLKDVAPIYYALGNHEENYMEQGNEDLIQELTNAGAVVLEEDYVDLETGGVETRLGGLYGYAFGTDPKTGYNEADDAPREVREFLEEFQDTDRLKIMMSHRPDSFIFGDASKAWDIDLVISAHDHGGQVVLPFLGGLYGGDQGWFPKYVHGLYQKDIMQIFVTSGLGTNKKALPRFNNPPEIAVLHIIV